jgi:hypothetical protein
MSLAVVLGPGSPATLPVGFRPDSSSAASFRSVGDVRIDQNFQHLTDRSFSTDGISEGQIGLDGVPVTTALFVLDDVAGCNQVGNDSERAAFGDADRRGDVAQTHSRIVGDADEDSGMVGEEAPLRHATKCSRRLLEIIC